MSLGDERKIGKHKDITLIDITEQFIDNVILKKPEIILVGHWTGGSTASGAIQHLDTRNDVDGDGIGDGSVGYNFITNRAGVVYLLAEWPNFMHNTGKGTRYDQHTIAYSVVMTGPDDMFTELEAKAVAAIIYEIKKRFTIKKHVCHAMLNDHKIDFPQSMWMKFLGAVKKYS